MTDEEREALKIALREMSLNERRVAQAVTNGDTVNIKRYDEIIKSIQVIEKMLRKPAQGRMF